jgi:hypothetical protein
VSQNCAVPEETEEDLTEPEEDGGRLWWGGFVDDYEYEDLR